MNFKNLCTPSYAYLVVSLLGLIVISIQNLGNNNLFCLGQEKCPVSSTGLVFVIEILYILFFTWALNKLCELGYEKISWFLFLLPFVLMIFGLLAMIAMVSSKAINNKMNRRTRKLNQ